MNSDEKIAESYLQNLKIGKVDFEPNGNIPPDFVLDKKIGIEVRRLNKYIGGKPIESLEFGDIRKIEKLVTSYKLNKVSNTTFPVSIRYSRPLNFKKIKPKIYQALKHFEDNNYEKFEYFINDNFSLDIITGTERFETDFEIMIWLDHDKGGYVKYDLKNNIIHALKVKEELVSQYIEKYKEWWLILINHISSGIRKKELEFLSLEIPKSKIFKKVIILELNNEGESIINSS